MSRNLITFVYYCYNYLKMNCTLCLIKIHHYNNTVLRALAVFHPQVKEEKKYMQLAN